MNLNLVSDWYRGDFAMVALTKQPHTFKRGNVYYFRIAIPMRLQKALGKEYKRSLQTGDSRIASRICRIMSNKAEDFFVMVTHKIPTQQDLRQFMRDYFEQQLESARIELADAQGMFYGSEPDTASSDPYGFLEQAYYDYTEAKQVVSTFGNSADHENAAEEMLLKNGFETIPYAQELAAYFGKALIEVNRIKAAFLKHDFQDIEIQHSALKGCYNPFDDFEVRSQNQISLRDCVKAYLEYKAPLVEAKTLKQINAYLDRLTDILNGDTIMHKITKKNGGRQLEETVRKIPAHFIRDHKSKGKALMGMINENEEYTPISAKTANSHWTYFQEFFNWAVDREYLENNPIQGITFKYAKNRREKPRTPFTDEQLQTLFESAIYTGRKHRDRKLWEAGNLRIKDGNFWLPLIGLYTGMREGEILHLTPNDIKEKDGVHYIDINEDFCKRTKTEQSVRKVPIHSDLIKIGLLSYVKTRKKSIGQHGHIFEDGITIPENQEITKNYSRSFGEYTVRVGVRETKNNKEVFHSFRHNLRTALKGEGVTSQRCDAIVGHEPSKDSVSTGDLVYTHGEPCLKSLYKDVCKVNYNIDLSHLYEE